MLPCRRSVMFSDKGMTRGLSVLIAYRFRIIDTSFEYSPPATDRHARPYDATLIRTAEPWQALYESLCAVALTSSLSLPVSLCGSQYLPESCMNCGSLHISLCPLNHVVSFACGKRSDDGDDESDNDGDDDKEENEEKCMGGRGE